MPRRTVSAHCAADCGVYTGVHIRDSNPGPVFTIPGLRIEKFLIPGSRRDYAVGRYPGVF